MRRSILTARCFRRWLGSLDGVAKRTQTFGPESTKGLGRSVLHAPHAMGNEACLRRPDALIAGEEGRCSRQRNALPATAPDRVPWPIVAMAAADLGRRKCDAWPAAAGGWRRVLFVVAGGWWRIRARLWVDSSTSLEARVGDALSLRGRSTSHVRPAVAAVRWHVGAAAVRGLWPRYAQPVLEDGRCSSRPCARLVVAVDSEPTL